jgi:hypothetical protein
MTAGGGQRVSQPGRVPIPVPGDGQLLEGNDGFVVMNTAILKVGNLWAIFGKKWS